MPLFPKAEPFLNNKPLFPAGGAPRRRRELRKRHTPEALKLSREVHEANKPKLKSDLKKTTAFTKKVKQLSEDQRASLDKDLDTLNLSRYVSEIVDAVAENKLKNADVSVAVHLCCLMHQRWVHRKVCVVIGGGRGDAEHWCAREKDRIGGIGRHADGIPWGGRGGREGCMALRRELAAQP